MFSTLKDLLDADEIVEIRGDGKAGSGLLMAMQTFGHVMGDVGKFQIQEWPQFSSARKGANVRAFMRIATHPIHSACAIVCPTLSILLDEGASEEVDFASGMRTGIFLVNSSHPAWDIARKYHLNGTVAVFDGNHLGEKFFGQRIGNISLYAALVRVSGCISADQGREALRDTMKKRRLPESVQASNLACYDESLGLIEIIQSDAEDPSSHELPTFNRFVEVPVGAQSELRTSLKNRTSRYRPQGLRLLFADSTHKCSGCALCLTNCPENIISFIPDEKRGLRVMGANVNDFCKLCWECVEVCPVELFSVEEEAI